MIPQIKNQVQRATTMTFDELKFPCFAEIKYDGARVLAFVEIKHDGKHTCELYTRNEKLINSPAMSAKILDACRDMDRPRSFVLDGEMCADSGKMSGRTIVNGAINSAVKGGILDDIHNTEYFIFDIMHRNDFDDKSCLHSYLERRKALLESIDDYGWVRVAERVELDNPRQAEVYYNAKIAMGFEGMICKQASSLYAFKKSRGWGRFKEVKTADLKCVGWNYGLAGSKYENSVGALLLEGKVEGKDIKVKVGSGLSDLQREQHDDYEGKTIEVKYNSITQDKTTGQHSLFLPRFVCIREDK